MMKHLPILPDVILNHIYEYNSNHRSNFLKSLQRIRMVPVLKHIPLKAVNQNMQNILTEYDRQIHEFGNWDLYSLLRKKINDPDHWIQTYATCRCCKRHQTKKPCCIHDYNFRNTTLIHDSCIPIPDIDNCQCDCRHSSRFIFKSFNNLYENNESFSRGWFSNDDDSDTESVFGF